MRGKEGREGGWEEGGRERMREGRMGEREKRKGKKEKQINDQSGVSSAALA